MPRSVLTTRISLHSSPVSSTEGTKPVLEFLLSFLGLSLPVIRSPCFRSASTPLAQLGAWSMWVSSSSMSVSSLSTGSS